MGSRDSSFFFRGTRLLLQQFFLPQQIIISESLHLVGFSCDPFILRIFFLSHAPVPFLFFIEDLRRFALCHFIPLGDADCVIVIGARQRAYFFSAVDQFIFARSICIFCLCLLLWSQVLLSTKVFGLLRDIFVLVLLERRRESLFDVLLCVHVGIIFPVSFFLLSVLKDQFLPFQALLQCCGIVFIVR